jgi:hypothetical protein
MTRSSAIQWAAECHLCGVAQQVSQQHANPTCHGVLYAQLGTLSTTAQKGFGGTGGAATAAAAAAEGCESRAPEDSSARPADRVSLLDACVTRRAALLDCLKGLITTE